MALPCAGVEALDARPQRCLVHADVVRELGQGVGSVEVVRRLASGGDAEDAELVPVGLVEDQPRRGVGHGPGLGVDLAHDGAELVVGQGLVGEPLALAVDHDAVREGAFAEEHAAERPALSSSPGSCTPGIHHASCMPVRSAPISSASWTAMPS